MLKAPFPWFGGKSRAAGIIWQRFGDVPNYVEPFAGSLAVLLARPREARNETVNDLDALLANFWRALQADPEAVAYWADYPVIETDLHARHAWLVHEGRPLVARLAEDPNAYDARVAGWWVWGVSMWIGSGWCADVSTPARRKPRTQRGGMGVHHALPQSRPVLSGSSRGVNAAALTKKKPHLNKGGRGVLQAKLTEQKRPWLDRGGRGVQQHGQDVYGFLGQLSERLRRVRVCCGDWSRVVTPAVTVQVGTTAVLLDPPYHEQTGRDMRCYAVDSGTVAAEVRAWALENGDNPQLRIALCGYEGEHEMPAGWECVPWKAMGGYANQAGRAGGERERIWFSPHCLRPATQLELFQEVRLAKP